MVTGRSMPWWKQAGAFLRLLPPLTLVAIPYIQRSSFYTERWDTTRPIWWVMVGVYAAIGAAMAAGSAGNFQHLAEIAGPSRNRAYRETINALMAVAAFASVGGGWIASRYGYDRLFLTGAGLALLAILASGILAVGATQTGSLAIPSRLRGARA